MKKQLIDSTLYTKRDMSSFNAYDINDNIFVDDCIRSLLGDFWYRENSYFKKNTENPGFTEIIQAISDEENIENYVLKFDKAGFTEEVVYENNLEYPQIKFNHAEFSNFLSRNLVYNKIFYDHYTELEEIILNKENFNINTNYYKINKHYNYFSPFYEDSGRQLNSYEFLLPNIYDIFNLKNSFRNKQISLTNLSLDGMIPKDSFENILLHEEPNEITKKYFTDFGKAFTDKLGIRKIQQLVNLNAVESDRLFIESEILSADKLIGDKIPFPFYNYIEFSNNMLDNKVLDSLKNSNLYQDLIVNFYNNTRNEYNPKKYDFVINTPEVFSESLSLKIYDFKEWLLNILSLDAQAHQLSGEVMSKKVNGELLYEMLVNDVVIKNKKRNFMDIIKNIKSEKYPLFYRIEKHINSTSSQPIQTYIFPITSNKISKFFDTQVKYDKKYVYNISICYLIVGNEYKYLNSYDNMSDREADLKNGIFKIKISNMSSLKIVEVPYFEVESTIIQEPYNIPEIEIKNHLGDNSKISISSFRNPTDRLEKPRYLEDSDFDHFEKVMNFQGLKEQILFKNRDGIKRVQIYKTLNKPTSYSDFSGYLSDTITLDNNNSFSFDDLVIPNTTYYYAFRTINEHNIPSNLTNVYKISLIDENGIIYLNSEILELDKYIKKNNFKDMKRYLQIFPSINQTVIGNDMQKLEKYILKNHDAKEVKLGVSQNRVWDKTFKVRIRSKSTGKLVEFYFKFKQNNK